jgi:hypothetical protein
MGTANPAGADREGLHHGAVVDVKKMKGATG